MNDPTQILIVEDRPLDADLAMREIRKVLNDCEFQCVDNGPAFLEALEKFQPDLVLSDYHLPHFTGMEALNLVKERYPLLPLIIYTGSLSEDTAVDCMKAGAANYIIKENIRRLGSAVVHALEEKQIRIERSQAEAALLISEARYRQLVEGAPDIVYTYSNKRGGIYYSSRVEQILGYSIDYLYANPFLWDESIHPDDKNRVYKSLLELEGGKPFINEYRIQDAKGNWHWLMDRSIGKTVGSDEFLIEGLATDITDRKKAEERIENQLNRLAALRKIDMAISSSFDLGITINTLLEQLRIQLIVDAAVVLLYNRSLNELEHFASNGFRGKGINRLRLKVGEEYAGEAFLKRQVISIPDLKNAEHALSKAVLTASEGFESFIAIPLIAKGMVNGVLEVFHRSRLDRDGEWMDYLMTLAGQAAIAIDGAQVFEGLQRSNAELMLAYDATIEGWSQAMDLRDKETEGHTQRVVDMTIQMARFSGMTSEQIAQVRRGALLHDIGKLGVPDAILLKPDKLTDEEWVIMRKHPQFAFDMLSSIDFLRPALDIPYCHHERWDGTGYPRGLNGEQIPLGARLFSIVDVWDALRSDRPYRPGWPDEKVLEHIRQSAGTHFDPKAVEIFFKVREQNHG